MKAGAVQDKRNRRIKELGRHYWKGMRSKTPGLFDKRYWQGRIIAWIMRGESFKIDAFRFINVLPDPHSVPAFSAHVHDYLLKEDRQIPGIVRRIFNMTEGSLSAVSG
jgi:RHH-type proline utilization regulon transcriptional repressor/proline dehydrogenase/delta 1-pyrroline-5-carboxylate dehydrogenase